MIARWKQVLATVSACALTTGMLSACTDTANSDSERMTLVVWASQEDQADKDSWLQQMEQSSRKSIPNTTSTGAIRS